LTPAAIESPAIFGIALDKHREFIATASAVVCQIAFGKALIPSLFASTTNLNLYAPTNFYSNWPILCVLN